MKFLEELAARRRFGMKPGIETIRSLCAALGDPQKAFKAVHVAGTNGKGAVCAMLDASLRAAGLHVVRYTSPHLVRLNERFFLDGAPVDDVVLDELAACVNRAIAHAGEGTNLDVTFFEALTAVAFLLAARQRVDCAVLECGLGGRLDATNVCCPHLCVITKIGLDHCDWLGDTVEKIAGEKAGIIKPGVPIVLGRNDLSVRAVVEARARELGSPFFYAPEMADESEIPAGFSLPGAFNRENALTALAALKVLSRSVERPCGASGFALCPDIVWPGRFQRVGDFIIDGAHNPPAAQALASSLSQLDPRPSSFDLIAGFCGDKDVDKVLAILAPFVRKGYAVQTNNPRSLTADETAEKMRVAGIAAVACSSLSEAIRASFGKTVVCGSLFLAGEALVALNAYPWRTDRFDPSEALLVV